MQLKRRRGEEKPPAESPSSSSVRPVTRRQAAPTPKGADLDAADAYPTPAGSQRCPPASPSSTRSRTKGAEARTPAKSPPPRAPTTPRKSPQQRMTELPAIPALEHLCSADPKLAQIIQKVGPPTRLLEKHRGDPFTQLSKSIVSQQLSVKAAATILGRVMHLCGGDAAYSPSVLLAQAHGDLRLAGLSERKVEYLRGVAAAFQSGVLDPAQWDAMEDGELVQTLVRLKGLGEWSAHMFMIFHLGRADVVPVGDLVVRKVFQQVYSGSAPEAAARGGAKSGGSLPGREEMERIAAAWRPYRTLGSWYLWQAYDAKG